jgi:hypothetical protein
MSIVQFIKRDNESVVDSIALLLGAISAEYAGDS